MNIVELNEILRANAARVILVNSFYSEDVYKILNTKEVKYPAMVFNIQSTTENTNSRTFNGILYYADRLNEDFSNESMIHDASNTAIGSFINSLRDSETEDISVSNYTITHFEQKFADECAGGYANLAITVTNDCSVGEVLKFIEVEQDPVFKASPAAKITDAMIEKWDENSVSIEQVDEEIESKLSEKNYATKDEIPSVEGLASEEYVNEQIESVRSEIPSVEGLVSEEYVNEQIEAVRDEIPSLDGYATEQWVEEKNYATKDEIPSVEGLASEEWVNEQGFLREHQPLPDYSNTYAMKEHTHPEYVNPDYSTTYQPIGDYATRSEIPSLDGYATEQWVEDKGYLTEHQDLSEYAKKEELPDLEPYATKQYVQDQIIEAGAVTIEQVDAEIESKLSEKNYATKDEIPSVEGLASEQWVEEQGFLTEHQPLPDYSNTYAAKVHEHPEYVNPDYSTTYQPIGDYATRSEIPSLDGYATEQWVEDKNYATRSEIPSLDGYATEQWVEDQGYLTEHQPLPDYSNTYAAKVHEHPEYVNPDYSTTYQPIGDYATRSEIPSVEGLASEQWVEDKNYATRSEIPSLDGYATEQWVEEQGYTTMEAVESKGYLTEHQPLKTINGESIVGEGDIEIQGGGVTEDKVEELIDAHDFATVSQLDSYLPLTGGTLTLEEGVTLRTGVVELGIGTSKYKSSYIATSRSTFKNGELTKVTEPVYYSANGIIVNTTDGSYTLAFPDHSGIIATERGVIDVIEERGILSNYNLQEAPNYDKYASFRSKSDENLHSLIDYRGLWAEDSDTKKSIFYAAGYIKTGGWSGGKLNIPTIPSGTEETIATESQLSAYLPLTGGTLSLENDTNVEFGYFDEDIPGVLSFKHSYVALYQNITDAEGAVTSYVRTVIDGSGSLTKYNEKGEKLSKGNNSILTFNDAYTVIADNSVLASHPAVFARNDDKIVRFTSATDSKTTIVAYTGLLLEDSDSKKSTYYKVGYITSDSNLQLNLPTSDVAKEETIATEEWVEDKNYLTEHQSLKTINGQSIVGTGNIEIQGGSGVTEEKVEELIGAHDFATQTELASYLPLTGGTLSGTVHIGEISKTAERFLNVANNNERMRISKNAVAHFTGSTSTSDSSIGFTASYIRTSKDLYMNSYATGNKVVVASELASYLPLSGGTMTGPITLNGGGQYRYAYAYSPIVKESSDAASWCPAMCVRSTSYDFSIGTIDDRFRFIITNRDSATNNRTDYLLPVRATDKNVLETITTEEWVNSRYLPLSGGTMKGQLHIGGTSDSASYCIWVDRSVNSTSKRGVIGIKSNGGLYIEHRTSNVVDNVLELNETGLYTGDSHNNTSKVVTAANFSFDASTGTLSITM